MGEYAPPTLVAAGKTIAKRLGGTFVGVVGDLDHGTGYHRSRHELLVRGLTRDYSIQADVDRSGDDHAASAIDVRLPKSQMIAVTRRLISHRNSRSARKYLREFFGTADGRTVTGVDFRSGDRVTSDDSHLWHVHLSVTRRYATSKEAADAIVRLVTEDDMDLDDKVKLSEWIPARWPDLDSTITVRTALGSSYGHARSAKEAAHDAVARVAALDERMDRIEAKLDALIERLS